jgi:hypothetical protein
MARDIWRVKFPSLVWERLRATFLGQAASGLLLTASVLVGIFFVLRSLEFVCLSISIQFDFI